MNTTSSIAKDFIEHYEKLLGEINTGWKYNIKNKEIRVSEILNSPVNGVITYATLGFSEFVFDTEYTHRRYEFFISIYDKYKDMYIKDILISFSEYIINFNYQIKIGDIFKGDGNLLGLSKSGLKNYFCYLPVYYNKKELYVFKKCNPFVHFVWLIFINDNEMEYIKLNGWENFIDLLDEKDPDFLDLCRPSIV